MLETPNMPELTPGEASGYTVAVALVALAQLGDLGEWAQVAAIVTAGIVAAVTVLVTGRIREARNGTEQARLESLASHGADIDLDLEE